MSKHSSRQVRGARRVLPGLLVLGVSLMGQQARAADPPAADKDKEKPKDSGDKSDAAGEDYRNWFDLSVGGVFVDGDKAALRRREQVTTGAYGGVESFHYEQDVAKKGIMKVDGRGIFDNHDYNLKLEVSHPDVGYLRAGYREYRTWYDPSGGFFPQNSAWFPLYAGDKFALDRGDAFIEAGLTLPKRPQFDFSYHHQFREGLEDSTIWGDTRLTGLGGTTPFRSIVPSFWNIHETRDILAADIKHTLYKTDFELGVSYEIGAQDNSLNISRRPGEVSSTVALSPSRDVTQHDIVNSDLFNAHASTETHLSEKTTFTTGYSFTTLDSDLSGSRIYGSDFEQLYDPTFQERPTYLGYTNLVGGSTMRQHVVNLNLMFTPANHWTVVPSMRIEKNDLSGNSSFVLTPLDNELVNAGNQSGFLDVSESIEVRYTGFTNWVCYARGYWLEGQGTMQDREQALLQDFNFYRDTDFDRFTQQYTLGANWYPLRQLNFAAQYYHKQRSVSNNFQQDSTDNSPLNIDGYRYPAYILDQSFDTDDMNFRVTWRPFPTVTSVTRYDFQLSTIGTQMDQLSKLNTAEETTHIIAQSISWNPHPRLYLQLAANYVLNSLDTSASQILGTTNLIANAINDYWSGSLTAGYALDKKSDVQATYTYYRADDYQNNSAYTQPYGAGDHEHSVTASFIRRLRKNLTWTVKYGYIQGRDQTSGLQNDFAAHLVSTSWQYRF